MIITQINYRSFNTSATAVLYFQRFYIANKFEDFDRYVIAAACLFLAGKVEETPKKSKSILDSFRTKIPESFSKTFGDDPKSVLFKAETELIEALRFDFKVEHPYQYLIRYIKKIENIPQKTMQKLVQMSWTFINDSMSTTLCIQWEPDIVAISSLYLSSKVLKIEIECWEGKNCHSSKPWWEYFVDDVNKKLIECVCHCILNLYSDTP
ncbi:MAG: hypothetical protein MHMPM18_003839 [Marteilia pararefringens]